MTIDHETFRAPELMLDPALEEEQRIALEGLQSVLHTDPELLEEAVRLFFDAPEAVGRVMAFVRQRADGVKILEVVDTVLGTKLDMEVDFDPETEAAVTEDPTYRIAIQRFQATGQEVERSAFRRRRFGIAIGRARAARAARAA